MSNELEAAIRTSLQESSEHLTPDPDLAGQVRTAITQATVAGPG